MNKTNLNEYVQLKYSIYFKICTMYSINKVRLDARQLLFSFIIYLDIPQGITVGNNNRRLSIRITISFNYWNHFSKPIWARKECCFLLLF